METKINYNWYWSCMKNRLDAHTNMYYREYKEYVKSIYPNADIRLNLDIIPKYRVCINPLYEILIGKPRFYEHTAWKSAWQELKKLSNEET